MRAELTPALPVPSSFEDMQADYATIQTRWASIRWLLFAASSRRVVTGVPRTWPRPRMADWVRYAGIMRMRQRPQTASGVTFVTLEDEHGMVNAAVKTHVSERQHRVLVESHLLAIDGRLERVDGVQHLIVERWRTSMRCWPGLRPGVGIFARGLFDPHAGKRHYQTAIGQKRTSGGSIRRPTRSTDYLPVASVISYAG